jgi:hypothetical protein
LRKRRLGTARHIIILLYWLFAWLPLIIIAVVAIIYEIFLNTASQHIKRVFPKCSHHEKSHPTAINHP